MTVGSGRMDEGGLGFCAINDNISLALGKLLPLQGDRRATTVTQGDCPGLGGAALSGRAACVHCPGLRASAPSGRAAVGYLIFRA